MSDYRRYFVAGATYFFTVVTARREPLFAKANARTLLGEALRECQQRYPFETPASVLLPNHLHVLWTLPAGDANYSRRWAWIKRRFTSQWISAGDASTTATVIRAERRRSVWQRRFWEHTIRDVDDFDAHFDYIHFNPVKHGLAQHPSAWRWSTFHRWVQAGHYPLNWATEPCDTLIAGAAGE